MDAISQCIFLNENVSILIEISLKFVPKSPINNISAVVQIMAWRRPGDKPLSEPMMVSLRRIYASLGLNELTHLPLDKIMVAISQTNMFRWVFMNENICILINISLKFAPKGPIGNNPALV